MQNLFIESVMYYLLFCNIEFNTVIILTFSVMNVQCMEHLFLLVIVNR